MGMASTQRDVLSNIVKMYECPSDGVTGPIMSRLRSEKLGAKTGLCLVGGVIVRPTLTSWHGTHSATYLATSFLKFGQ